MNGGQPTKTKQRSAVGSRVVTEGTTIAKCVAKLLLRLPRQLQCPFVRASTLRPPLLPERRLLVSSATRGLYVRHENSFGTSLLGLNLVLARAVLIASVRLMQTTQSPRTCANRRTTIPARKFSRITFIESLDLSEAHMLSCARFRRRPLCEYRETWTASASRRRATPRSPPMRSLRRSASRLLTTRALVRANEMSSRNSTFDWREQPASIGAFRSPRGWACDLAPCLPPFITRVRSGSGPVWTGLQTRSG